jgi:hypothetical protein
MALPTTKRIAEKSGMWNCLSVSALVSLLSAAAVWLAWARGCLLYYGDAEAHLNTARRIFDSTTPGFDQLGTPWLPLPHLLMLPLVRVDGLWRSGLAGAIPSAVCFVAAAVFLFAAVRRLFGSPAVALSAVALFALNPNVLYLQSIPMAEPVFWAALAALLYFTVRFGETGGWGSAIGAGCAACAASLARYEGWFLIPFVAVYLARRRVWAALVFCLIAVCGPLFWLGYNWWLTGDALYFYRGPGSAIVIQGRQSYPGRNDWRTALYYYRTAAELAAGPVLALAALAGAVAALIKRAFWPLFLLLLPGVFYVWSMHSSASPIFVPVLWPGTYYNSRYGTAALPLAALAASALVALVPPRARQWAAAALVAASIAPWILHPHPSNWVVWEESRVNSEARREWTRQAAEFLGPRYIPGSGILTMFGDVTGIYRAAGIPLRQTFTECNGLPWLAAVRRPELFLWQEWAVVRGGDEAQSAMTRAALRGIPYRLEKTIIVKGAPVVEIYRRTGGFHGSS